MPKNSYSNRRRRGSAMLFYIVLLPVLILIAGLAIDVTMQYIVQAQLQTAVDGAAGGAMRLLGTGADTTEIANEFLTANMPASYWWSSTLVPHISTSSTSGTQTINVSATTQVPLFFMRFLGLDNSTVAASSVATGRLLTPCTIGYPSGTAPALSSVVFNESTEMVGFGPTYVAPHGTIRTWYNDEHAITLGVRQVVVTTASGTTTTDYSFTAFTGALQAANANAPLLVGTTALTGDQAGTDLATWNSTYGYLDKGRPMWPALFVTDITSDPDGTSGDWQQGGTTAIPPNIIYGSWKGAVRTVDHNPSKPPKNWPSGTPVISVNEDNDPATKNNWNGVPDTPPGGFPTCGGYCSEVVWNVDSLKLKTGHTYRMEFMIHDGDQNKVGGDSGEACVVTSY
jgi:Flp pilus assembly protein TadG